MSPTNSLGTFLRTYRQNGGLTAQDLAQRCQVPVSVILDLEHGDRPEPEHLQALSEGLGIPLVEIHRIAQGEPTAFLAPTPRSLPDLEPASDLDRSPTILEAVQGLSPAQIEKVMDYIQLLKHAEQGRRQSASS
jgi:transcriptional regulator with XRE-family HTH domain